MAYIANKPVRFDRDYKVGEVIPDAVISSGMTRKLMEMGRILHVDLPAPGGNAEDSPSPAPEDTQGGAGGEGGAIPPRKRKPPQRAQRAPLAAIPVWVRQPPGRTAKTRRRGQGAAQRAA